MAIHCENFRRYRLHSSVRLHTIPSNSIQCIASPNAFEQCSYLFHNASNGMICKIHRKENENNAKHAATPFRIGNEYEKNTPEEKNASIFGICSVAVLVREHGEAKKQRKIYGS